MPSSELSAGWLRTSTSVASLHCAGANFVAQVWRKSGAKTGASLSRSQAQVCRKSVASLSPVLSPILSELVPSRCLDFLQTLASVTRKLRGYYAAFGLGVRGTLVPKATLAPGSVRGDAISVQHQIKFQRLGRSWPSQCNASAQQKPDEDAKSRLRLMAQLTESSIRLFISKAAPSVAVVAQSQGSKVNRLEEGGRRAFSRAGEQT